MCGYACVRTGANSLGESVSWRRKGIGPDGADELAPRDSGRPLLALAGAPGAVAESGKKKGKHRRDGYSAGVCCAQRTRSHHRRGLGSRS